MDNTYGYDLTMMYMIVCIYLKISDLYIAARVYYHGLNGFYNWLVV